MAYRAGVAKLDSSAFKFVYLLIINRIAECLVPSLEYCIHAAADHIDHTRKIVSGTSISSVAPYPSKCTCCDNIVFNPVPAQIDQYLKGGNEMRTLSEGE